MSRVGRCGARLGTGQARTSSWKAGGVAAAEPHRRGPAPRRGERRLTPTGVGALLLPGVRRVAAQIPALEAAWAANNAEAAAASGPLWVAIGDSTAQGIGASSWERTALALVLHELRAVTGEPWRLVNLAVYGAKIDAIVAEQAPRLTEFGTPDLVTVGAGSNDVIFSRGLRPLLERFERLLEQLPAASVVGTVPPGWFGKGLHVNDWLRQVAGPRRLRIAEVGVFPSPRAMVAADRLHPNDAGYRFIANGLLTAIGVGPRPGEDRPVDSDE